MRIIDADELLEHLPDDLPYKAAVKRVLIQAPEIDAMPVVRCKDCKYGEVDDADFPAQYLCNHNGADWNDGNHFCSYGERKEGAD